MYIITFLHVKPYGTYNIVIKSDAHQTGSAQGTPASLSALVSTLIPVLIVSLVYVLVFLILRRSQRRQYAPRTYLSGLRPE